MTMRFIIQCTVQFDDGHTVIMYPGDFEMYNNSFVDVSRYICRYTDGVKIINQVWSDSDFNLIREAFMWTSYGRNGDEPARKTLLKDLDSDHICAIINNCTHLYQFDAGRQVLGFMQSELARRQVN